MYSATGRSRANVKLSDDTKVLTVSGVQWDRVRVVEKIKTQQEIEILLYLALLKYDNDPGIYEPTDETLPQAHIRTLCLDKTKIIKRNDVKRWQSDTWERLKEIKQLSRVKEQAADLTWSRLRERFNRLAYNRKFLYTKDNNLGIATAKVEVGDVIALLFGSETPIVLRPLEELNHYEFVADCYVHGFMDGEALVEARKDSQPEHDPADVTWLQDPDLGGAVLPIQKFHIH